MGNDGKAKINKIIKLVEKLPYFSFDDLVTVEENRTYLKILLSRYTKAEKLVRLKRGMYVTKKYLDQLEKSNFFSAYLEFIAGTLYQPSYLSLEYVLYGHNILTEIPVNFTSITENKTTSFFNPLGNFFYHKIKKKLFCGFAIVQEGDFLVFKATKAKALFDFLYLRKNIIANKKAAQELRLNLDNFNKKDLKEIKKYFELEGSKKMSQIYGWLFK